MYIDLLFVATTNKNRNIKSEYVLKIKISVQKKKTMYPTFDWIDTIENLAKIKYFIERRMHRQQQLLFSFMERIPSICFRRLLNEKPTQIEQILIKIIPMPV